MTIEQEALRDWHRLFGLLLMDFFSGSPFKVEVERDLSAQQQRPVPGRSDRRDACRAA